MIKIMSWGTHGGCSNSCSMTNSLGSRGGKHVPQCPIAGNASVYIHL